MKLSSLLKSSAFLLTLAASPLLAHEEHCHVIAEDGTITDYKGADTKTKCNSVKNSTWLEHAHCLIKNASGTKDSISIHTKEVCLAQKGEWKDHVQKAEH